MNFTEVISLDPSGVCVSEMWKCIPNGMTDAEYRRLQISNMIQLDGRYEGSLEICVRAELCVLHCGDSRVIILHLQLLS